MGRDRKITGSWVDGNGEWVGRRDTRGRDCKEAGGNLGDNEHAHSLDGVMVSWVYGKRTPTLIKHYTGSMHSAWYVNYTPPMLPHKTAEQDGKCDKWRTREFSELKADELGSCREGQGVQSRRFLVFIKLYKTISTCIYYLDTFS